MLKNIPHLAPATSSPLIRRPLYRRSCLCVCVCIYWLRPCSEKNGAHSHKPTDICVRIRTTYMYRGVELREGMGRGKQAAGWSVGHRYTQTDMGRCRQEIFPSVHLPALVSFNRDKLTTALCGGSFDLGRTNHLTVSF